MSGICGFLRYDNHADLSSPSLGKTPDAWFYCGSDGYGHFEDDAVILGYPRLDIEGDPRSEASRTITNEDGTLAMVFDGELYNAPELRRCLGAHHRFKSDDPREVLLHAYEDEGERVLTRLDAVFACAIWDRTRRTLFCARDKFGVKPFHYAAFREGFVFASQAKAIVRACGGCFPLHLETLSKYLAYGYVPSPGTLWTNVFQLPPSYYLAVDISGKLQTSRYWRISFQHHPGDPLYADEKQVCDKLYGLFRESVERRLESVASPGIFLSGGLDSSSIVACMSDLGKCDDIRTFSVRFPEATYDESAYADLVAGFFSTRHQKITITSTDVASAMPDVVKLLDQPVSDGSIIARYLLARHARESVPMILTGDGGDELFAGYPTYHAHRLLRALRFLPPARIQSFINVARRFAPVSDRHYGANLVLQQLANGIGLAPEIMNQVWLGSFDPERQRSLFRDELGLKPTRARVYEELYAYLDDPAHRNLTDIIDILLAYYLTFNFPPDIAKVEWAAAANSLCVRYPFLDEALMTYSFSLESRFKVRRLTLKYILRRAMSARLPAEIVWRSKRGFTPPVSTWLKTDLKQMVTDLLSYESMARQGLFDPKCVQSLLKEHFDGIRDNRKEIWTLVMFVLWQGTAMTSG